MLWIDLETTVRILDLILSKEERVYLSFSKEGHYLPCGKEVIRSRTEAGDQFRGHIFPLTAPQPHALKLITAFLICWCGQGWWAESIQLNTHEQYLQIQPRAPTKPLGSYYSLMQ